MISVPRFSLTMRGKQAILYIEKVLSAMVSSLWLVNKNDRSGLGLWGGHFLLLWISLKIVHVI